MIYGDSKYHSRQTEVDGIKFASKKEANYYCELKMLRMAGEIKDFDMQVAFELQKPYRWRGKAVRAIKYIADFVVTYPDGRQEVIDTKGYRTDIYKLKKKLLLFKYPELNFKEV